MILLFRRLGQGFVAGQYIVVDNGSVEAANGPQAMFDVFERGEGKQKAGFRGSYSKKEQETVSFGQVVVRVTSVKRGRRQYAIEAEKSIPVYRLESQRDD